MSTTLPSPDSLAQVHELNRLFLKSLQRRDAVALRDSGFPAGAIEPLRHASSEQLDSLARFPRTLFDLALDSGADRGAEPSAEITYGSRQILELTILFSAWTVSRDSVYHARLFYGLTPRAVHTLRTLPLSELQRVALTAARVTCAFAEAEWLWWELLSEARPEIRRRLILIALQPSLDGAQAFDRVAE